jgi:type I restriction enzyme, S subunit
MAADWKQVPLSYICQHSAFGPRFPGTQYSSDGNVATLRTTDISEHGRIEYTTMPRARLDIPRFQRHFLQKDDLVITRSGRVGTAAVFDHYDLPVLPGAFLIRFRLKRDIADPHFYRYYFNSPSGRSVITSVATGSVQQNLNITSLHGLRVLLPPVGDQQAIAHVLSTFDKKIDSNRRMNKALEAIARAMFKSWFIEFDPVRAKAEGRQPFGMDAETADLFPDSFQDSPIGNIPRGWRIGKVSEFCTTQYGYTTSATEEPVGPKFLRVTDINKRNWIEWDSVPHCHISEVDKPKYSLSPGDIVVARMADPGKSALIEESVDAIFASYLVRLKTRSVAQSHYVYGFLKSQAYEEYSQGVISGSVQANMNAKVIVGADVLIPPDRLINAYADHVSPLRQRIVCNVRQTSTLGAIRDTLSPKLISGEIRVKDAETVC